MSGSINRRRRRTGSTSARYHPSQLVPVESVRPGRMGKVELAACGAVAIVAFALIALIWILTQRAVQDQQIEIRERAEHALSAQAATIAETIGHELLMIDQSLMVLQAAWKADSGSVDLMKWQATMPALTAVTDDLFISDELRIIRQDILPKAVGQGVGSAYVTFPHGSLEQFQSDGTKNKDTLLLQGDAGQPIDARHFLMYVIRPLDHPTGWLIGASYRSEELTKLFAALSRMPSGLWLGETPIDDTQRMHAFQQVPNRDMSIVVAANWTEVMAVADNLAAGAHALATVGSALVLVIAGIVLWEVYMIRSNKRQKRVFDRTRIEMERLRGEEGVLTARAQLNAARLKVVVDSTSDGIALFGSNLRIVQWNHPFHRGIGIELKHDMPLDSLLRAQGGAGLFGKLANIEAEVSRRVAVLQSGDTAGASQPGPDGEALILRGLPITEGGFILLLNGLETWEPAPAAASPEIDEPAAPETVTAAPIEW